MNKLRENYRNIFIELADMNLLETILQSITGSTKPLPKMSENLSDKIKDAEYCLS